MTQTRIDLAVARATGESLNRIRSLGFGIADPTIVCYAPEPPRRFHRRRGNAQREDKLARRRRQALLKQLLSRAEPSTSRKGSA